MRRRQGFTPSFSFIATRKWLLALLLGCAPFLLTVPLIAQQSELQVLDRNGLIRFSTQVREAEAVEIRYSGPPTVEATLIHTDGLSAPLKGQVGGNGTILFARVPPGTWRVSFTNPGSGEELRSIRIDAVALRGQ